MTEKNLPPDIEIYQIGTRRLYVKTNGGAFAIFDDELTPEELVAIAQDIAARRVPVTELNHQAGPMAQV